MGVGRHSQRRQYLRRDSAGDRGHERSSACLPRRPGPHGHLSGSDLRTARLHQRCLGVRGVLSTVHSIHSTEYLAQYARARHTVVAHLQLLRSSERLYAV